MGRFDKTIGAIQYLLEDNTTPRTVRERLTNMVSYLRKEGDDDQRKIATALSELEDLSSDVNIPPYVRTQLYGISSHLEALGND